MRSCPIGKRYSCRIATGAEHTAEAFGNPGVRVVGTPALIGFLETAAHRCLEELYEEGEVSVGTRVDVRHLGAAPEGAEIEASAEVTEVARRRVTFLVEARHGAQLQMEGSHERAVVDLPWFLARLGMQGQGDGGA